ncbi:MAG TPA: divergent polysaccharide deacetylase family protein [Hyphomicrobiaceae bacterium]|nr:divergent polysaccharide deacetylase family protein [Hyphomicrobiaceae bacterium]
MKALAVAAGIVFWTLVLGTAWLAFFPGSDSGGPVAILQIQPATAPGADMPAAAPEGAPPPEASESPAPPEPPSPGQASKDGMELPPGFGVGPSGPPQAPIVEAPGAGQGPTLVPLAPGGQLDTPAAPPSAPDDAAPPNADQQGSAPAATPETQQTALETPASPPADVSAPPAVPETETGSIVLPPVPVAELVEESQYGPLPKVATDGRRPVEVYARPSRYAAATAGGPPRIAILVTGLGLPGSPPGDVLKGLPAPMSVAYGAYGRNLQDGVSRARDSGHEVLLQIPLEPDNYPTVDPGPHTLLTTLPPEENLKRLQWLMSRYAGYVGVTNHMGAKFEATTESLQPVLEELKRRGLLYVDDGSVQGSTAGQIAGAIGLDYSVVSVQIDAGNVAKQLAELEAAAKQRGAAIGVIKATPATIKQLVDWANKLEAKGFVLVPVSAAVRSQRQS